ncbi:hypothetical protein P4O66_002092 [Electrophorus voltai]|uniref:Reverse transcriptase domain-containing protein n=1 Tax=Electrophorus voltai TaxID=2609070 RepID=A0AAD8Z453_9TELE|nr:hypothetical protein P4O66_002092 [Electrophorus voltai]
MEDCSCSSYKFYSSNPTEDDPLKMWHTFASYTRTLMPSLPRTPLRRSAEILKSAHHSAWTSSTLVLLGSGAMRPAAVAYAGGRKMQHASEADALNDFYARFEAKNNVAAEKSILPQNDQVLCQTAADVRCTLRGVNPWKAAGPDNIPGRVLRECADQLADVLTDIFNISLSCAVVPTCFETTTIIPVPKKATVSCLNDYRPITLTSIIIRCFERPAMRHIKTQLPPSLDPLQFTHRSNHFTDDAISTTLHLALTHLDKKGTYVRMLFIDFSSAFNTIVPQHLFGKLSLLGLNTSLCNWFLDFLAGRPQSVQIGSSTSNTTTMSTGIRGSPKVETRRQKQGQTAWEKGQMAQTRHMSVESPAPVDRGPAPGCFASKSPF